MVTGCAVTISKYKVLFIGGHHTSIHKLYNSESEIQEHMILPSPKLNNLVIEYDFEKGAWKNLSDIPYIEVSDYVLENCENLRHNQIQLSYQF